MKIALFLAALSTAKKVRETQMIADPDFDYDFDTSSDDDYVLYDPNDIDRSSDDFGFLGPMSDTGGVRNLHGMCGGVKLPGISCKGCKKKDGFPRYDKPCHEPEAGNHGKFKCKVLCGPGFTPTIRRMKCIGNIWKKYPSMGAVRCIKDKQ
ncbi:Oidioi.mRNA.OKI2018_I69.PAR.g11699.t1.cds [Oikopleura dioica]|uniref:Oidioi.mRNA.OKI2018_I69.PAR.g11699.t1.cds n=1 Tax=Oikopleura dioica TaxID=34765 RepID=A0ABN7S151_OIKDI|nr:Oidioi.mRNA.OKI2018_I69.PAR.g11699.t1.cds [Oikopleura dioica]